MAGAAREVAVLASSEFHSEEVDVDSWNGGTSYHTLFLRMPLSLFGQIAAERGSIESNIRSTIDQVLSPQSGAILTRVEISPQLTDDDGWQEKARAWLAGSGVTNQGRVRSDNIASRVCDGLLFRSQPEINLYKALKAHGLSFAPLPVFIRGGETYRRIEPDFVVLHEGVVLVVEVDGDTVHQETPAEARSHDDAHSRRRLPRASPSERM